MSLKAEDHGSIAARLYDVADILETRSKLKAEVCREAAGRLLALDSLELSLERLTVEKSSVGI